MMDISITQALGRKPVTIMYLKGSFDSEGADTFDAQYREVIAGGAKDVLIDLSEVPFMSSVGIRSIHNLFYALHPKDSEEYQRILSDGIQKGIYKAPHMKLFKPTTRVLELLKMVSADMYIEILTGSEMEAVNSF